MHLPEALEPYTGQLQSHLSAAHLPVDALYFFHALRAICQYMAYQRVDGRFRIDDASKMCVGEMIAQFPELAEEGDSIINEEVPSDPKWGPRAYKLLRNQQNVPPGLNPYLLKSMMEGAIPDAMREIHESVVESIARTQYESDRTMIEPTEYSGSILVVNLIDVHNIGVDNSQVTNADIDKMKGFVPELSIIPEMLSEEGAPIEKTNVIIFRPLGMSSLFPVIYAGKDA